MDILKIVGTIAIAALVFSFLQKNFNFDFLNQITAFFTNIFFPSKQESFTVEILSKNFNLNSNNIELTLNGKITTFSINRASFKVLSEKSKLKISFNGNIEKKDSSLKIGGIASKILIDDNYEISNVEFSTFEISLNVYGEIEKIVISSSEKVEIFVDSAQVKIKRQDKTLEFNVLNDKIVLKNVLSLEYSNETFSIHSSGIESSFIKL
jgi:hypothetical protein